MVEFKGKMVLLGNLKFLKFLASIRVRRAQHAQAQTTIRKGRLNLRPPFFSDNTEATAGILTETTGTLHADSTRHTHHPVNRLVDFAKPRIVWGVVAVG